MNYHARFHSVLLLYYTDDEIGRDGKKAQMGRGYTGSWNPKSPFKAAEYI